MSSNKVIAKNTLFLYFRMFFNMAVSLYTSRIILKILGVEDFGIYNLVGGIVVLFTFLNGALSGATHRFINFEKASNIKENINRVFNISITTHIIISIIILLLAETIGIWILNNKLKIPNNRLFVSNIVFQLSVLTTIIDVLRVPYNSMIVAYEKMSYYAFVGILETVCKLLVVFSLSLFTDVDHLLLYGILLVAVNLVINIFYYVYCKKHFREETKLKYYSDRNKLKELFTFSGWLLIEQVAYVANTQGISIVVNLFHGVVGNASAGIANQANGAVYNFIRNFQTAFQPQIIQTYAGDSLENHRNLVLKTSKYSFFLVAILGVPFLLFPNTVLNFWLGSETPKNSAEILSVIIIISFIEAIAGPFWMSATAIGKIKKYTLTLTAIDLLTVPLAYIFMLQSFPITYVFIAKLITQILLQIFRYFYLNEILHFEKNKLFNHLKSIGAILLFLFCIYWVGHTYKSISLLEFSWKILSYETILILVIYLLGIDKDEKCFIMQIIKSKFAKK